MKKCAIVGTAPSWKLTPWDDQDLTIVSLNDAYMLGLKRVDEWYELHPLDHFYFRPKNKRVINAQDIPEGHYVRPEGHLEWLQEFAVKRPNRQVWLMDPVPEGWPDTVAQFPKDELFEKYGSYWASGPSYILMHLYDRGFRHFEIYGIHLSTEHEYREQRPNWEMLLGRLLGPTAKDRVEGEKRIWTGNEVTVVMPKDVPILKHDWKYGLEPRPTRKVSDVEKAIKDLKVAATQIQKQLVYWEGSRSGRKDLLGKLERVEARIHDQMELSRKQKLAPMVIEAKYLED